MSWLSNFRERIFLVKPFIKVHSVFSKLFDTQSWDDVRNVLRSYPELLTPAVDFYIEYVLQTNKKELNADLIMRFRLENEMLKRCRSKGVEHGIKEWIAEGHGLPFDRPGILLEVQKAHSIATTSENAKEQILFFEYCLDYISQEVYPGIRSLIFFRLGEAYSIIGTGDRAANIEQAIMYLEKGVKNANPKTEPEEWASLNLLLGIAYLERIGLPEKLEGITNQNRAMECFEAALDVYTKEQYPIEHKMALRRLAMLRLHYQLPEPYWSQNQEEVLTWYEEFLTSTSREQDLAEWVRIQIELGDAFQVRIAGEPTKNLETAIQHYRSAAEVISPGAPSQAEIFASLGDVFANPVWVNDSNHFQEALGYYRQSLLFFTRTVAPETYYSLQVRVGNLAFAKREWQIASEAYLEALSVSRQDFQLAITRESRHSELELITGVPENTAYALAQLGKTSRAVEILEQFRTRWLTESLKMQTVDLSRLQPQDRILFENIRSEISVLQAEERLPESDPNRRPFFAVASDLQQAFYQWDEICKKIFGYYPDLFSELDISVIQRACTSANPLVYLLTTSHGSLSLIVTNHGNPSAVWGTLTYTDSVKWIVLRENGKDPIVGSYFSNQIFSNELQKTIEDLVKVLGNGVMRPLALALHTLGVSQVTLVPTGALSSFPLHAAPTTEDETHFFVDDFQTAYVPSAQVLLSVRESIQNRANVPSHWAGFGVTELAEKEVYAIADQSSFDNLQIATNSEVTREKVFASFKTATVIHIACHAISMFVGDPFDSEIMLFGGEKVLLRELLQLDLKEVNVANLIILSACQTALPADFTNIQDELVGFPSVLLSRGIPVVIGAMWKVTDISTTLLMLHLYERLNAGDSIQKSLQVSQGWLRQLTQQESVELIGKLAQQCQIRARQKPSMRERWMQIYWTLKGRQQWLKDGDERPFASPYYWAGFQVVGFGDWYFDHGRLTLEQQKSEPQVISDERRLLQEFRQVGVLKLQADNYKEVQTQTAKEQCDRKNQELFKRVAKTNKELSERFRGWGYTLTEEHQKSIFMMMAMINAGKNPDWLGDPFYVLSEVNIFLNVMFGDHAINTEETNAEQQDEASGHPYDLLAEALDHLLPQFEELHNFALRINDLTTDDWLKVKDIIKEIRRLVSILITARGLWKELNDREYQEQYSRIESKEALLKETAQANYQAIQAKIHEFSESRSSAPDILRIGEMLVTTPGEFRKLGYGLLAARMTMLEENNELPEERRREFSKKTLAVMESTLTIDDVYGALFYLVDDFPEFQLVLDALDPKECGEVVPLFIPLSCRSWGFRVPKNIKHFAFPIIKKSVEWYSQTGLVGTWTISELNAPTHDFVDLVAKADQIIDDVDSVINQQSPLLFVWNSNRVMWDDKDFKDCLLYFFQKPSDNIKGDDDDHNI